jgi:hypothetical protein
MSCPIFMEAFYRVRIARSIRCGGLLLARTSTLRR